VWSGRDPLCWLRNPQNISRNAVRRATAAIFYQGTVLSGGPTGGVARFATDCSAFSPSTSANQWRGFLVSPDGNPGLPSLCLRDTAAGAASCSTSRTPHEAPLVNRTLSVYIPIGILSTTFIPIGINVSACEISTGASARMAGSGMTERRLRRCKAQASPAPKTQIPMCSSRQSPRH
jgi:hypothetical protein